MKRLLIIICVILIIPISFFAFKKYRNTRPVPKGSIPLEFPLKNGKFFITLSGKFAGRHTNPIEKYALDIVRFPALSSFFKFRQTGLEADITFGTAVYNPCTGWVKNVRDGIADQPIGIKNPKVPEGNMIIITCDGFNVMMAHFRKNSIKPKVGDQVQLGEEIGQIGNSGNTDGPHLHIMVYLSNNASGEKTPLPITFKGRYLYTWDAIPN